MHSSLQVTFSISSDAVSIVTRYSVFSHDFHLLGKGLHVALSLGNSVIC